jgi:PAS domain S-box-containing protein
MNDHPDFTPTSVEPVYHLLFDTMPLGTVIQQADGAIIAANQAAQKMLGMSLDQLRGRTSLDPRWQAIHEDGSVFPGEEHPAMQALRSGQIIRDVVMGVFNPETENNTWLNIIATPQFKNPGEPAYLVMVTFEDITARKQAEESQRASERTFTLFVENAPAAIAMFDRDMKYIAVSRRFLSDYGLEGQEVLGRSHYEIFPDIPERWKGTHRRCLAGAVEKMAADPFPREDGTLDWVRWEIHPWYQSPDEIGGILLFSEVITERKQAEKELSESEERFSTAFFTSPVAQSIQKVENNEVVAVNEACCRLFGYSRDELIGVSAARLNLWVDPADRLSGVEELKRTWRLLPREITARTRSGESITVLAAIEPISWKGIPCLISSVVDISARKRAEEALQNREYILRLFVEHSPAAIAMFDREMHYIVASRRYQVDYGLGDQELEGRSHYQVFPEMTERQKAIHRRCLAGASEKNDRDPLQRADGRVDWVRWEILPWYEVNGGIGGIIFFSEVITDRKQAEDALRESEKRLRMALETTSDGYWLVAASGRFQEVNPAYCAMSGYTRDEFLQMSIWDVDSQMDPEAIRARTRKIQQEGGDRYETRHRRKNGSIFDVEVSVNVLDPASGLMICFCRDITERKAAEGLLTQRLEDLALINKLNDAANHGATVSQITELIAAETKKIFGCQYTTVYLVNFETQTLVLQQFSMTRETIEKIERLMGRPIPPIRLPIGEKDHFSQVLNSDKGFLITGSTGVRQWLADFTKTSFLSPMVRPLIHKIIPGAARLLGIQSVISIPLKAGDEVLGMIEFVSDHVFDETTLDRLQNVRHQLAEVILRQRTEQSLRESHEKYRLLSEVLEERVKERAAQVQDLYDHAPVGYFSIDAAGSLININRTGLEWLGYAPEELTGRPYTSIFAADQARLLSDSFERLKREGLTHGMETTAQRRDGKTFPVTVDATAVYDQDGQFKFSRSVFVDITDLKRTEVALRESRSRLEMINQELEAFSYSVSHDLRAPLRRIDGFTAILAEDYQDKFDEQGRNYLERVRFEAQHMGQLISDLLGLSRVTRFPLRVSAVDLSALAAQILEKLQNDAPGRKVELILQPGMSVLGDPQLLSIALTNLLDNAWKYTGKRAAARIEFAMESGENGPVYYVRDNGAGFNMEYTQKLFSAFQRLHSAEEFSGTGIGLATVQRIIRRHNGKIWADAQVDVGATFYFTIGPIASDSK